jgi:YD repeat-containing protein
MEVPMKRMLNLFILMPFLSVLLGGCAPTGERVTNYYDQDGNLIRQVSEDVNTSKYSIYGPTIVGLVGKIEEGRQKALDTIKEMAQPRPGESSDLISYKAGQATAMTAMLSSHDYDDAIDAVHYGKDEYDVQDSAVHVGGDTLKTLGLATAAWKTLDTALEQAGDVTLGEDATYSPKENHWSGNDLGDGNSFDVSSENPSTVTNPMPLEQ